MRLIDADALNMAFTMLRFNEDGTLRHWGDRQNWCLSGQEVEDLINSIPTIDQEPHWIPCSERLPENGHYYLWCSDMGRVQSDYYWDGFENGMKYGYNIAAWMPLPKPYKGGEKDE